MLATVADVTALLERGFEVRLHRLAPAEPLPAELQMDDEEAIAWLEERVRGIPRREEGKG